MSIDRGQVGGGVGGGKSHHKDVVWSNYESKKNQLASYSPDKPRKVTRRSLHGIEDNFMPVPYI